MDPVDGTIELTIPADSRLLRLVRLVASGLALMDARRGIVPGEPKPAEWRIGIINLLGSIAFGVSAVAAYVLPSGSVWDAELANLGTFVGAVCFLIGAVLLLEPGKPHARGPR